MFALSKIRNLLPSNIKLTIYNSLFRSFVEYGISAWGLGKSKDMRKLSILQKRAVRLIDNSKKAAHSDPLFLKFKILKIQDMVDFNQGIFMYKYVNNMLPTSFANLFKELGTFERSLNFQIDILHLNDLKIFPSYALIKSWNSLPLYLKRSETLNILKKNP